MTSIIKNNYKKVLDEFIKFRGKCEINIDGDSEYFGDYWIKYTLYKNLGGSVLFIDKENGDYIEVEDK